jgi:hypothetical protein
MRQPGNTLIDNTLVCGSDYQDTAIEVCLFKAPCDIVDQPIITQRLELITQFRRYHGDICLCLSQQSNFPSGDRTAPDDEAGTILDLDKYW